MTWPAGSPHLSSLEVVGDKLDRRVKEKQHTDALHLWEPLGKSCEDMSGDSLHRLVSPVPHVCETVIKANGGYFENSKIFRQFSVFLKDNLAFLMFYTF